MVQLESPMFEMVVTSLGWTLLHFLWQGALAGVLFGIALACAARSSARTRYHIGLFFLAVLAAAPVVTFFWLMPDAPVLAAASAQAAAAFTVTAAPQAVIGETAWQTLVQPFLPWTVLVWAFGVLLMTARLLFEWRAVRLLTRVDVEPLSAEWQARVARLHQRLKVHRAVLVLCSARVNVPLVVGWLRPVILVPVSAFTGLTPWQLELILMHELAHVRRHDYIVNLLQVVVETLLFYHPVVRWVSRVVREEREHCCDDLVVARSGDALSYAHALTELAGAQSMGLQTSVGSDGGKLLTRIKRLVIANEPQRVSTHWSVGAMLAVFGMSISTLLQPGSQRTPDPAESAALAEVAAPRAAVALEATAPAGVAARIAPVVDALAGLDVSADLVAAVTQPVLAPVVVEPAIATAPSQSGGGPSTVADPASRTSVGRTAAAVASAPAAAVVENKPGSAAAPLMAEIVRSRTPIEVGAPPALPQVAQPAMAPASAPASATTMAASAAMAPAAAAPARIEPEPEASQSGEAATVPTQRIVRPLSGRQPEFPADARLDGVEGWVKFTYKIARDGTVRSVQVVDAEPRNVFESAVRRAVRSWRFEPAMVDGSAVEREVTQVIQFSLGPAASAETCNETGTRLCR